MAYSANKLTFLRKKNLTFSDFTGIKRFFAGKKDIQQKCTFTCKRYYKCAFLRKIGTGTGFTK